MIVDEVQTGFARTGRWFGFEHAGVRPDVVTMAKAMGNGFPVGACWARREVAAVFEPGDHGSTYSGTAIATAAVQRGDRRDAPHRRAARSPAEQGARLRAALRGARRRGLGPRPAGCCSPPSSSRARGAGRVPPRCSPTGSSPTPSRRRRCGFAPPLTVSDAEIDEAVAMIARALAVMTRHLPRRRRPRRSTSCAAVLDLASRARRRARPPARRPRRGADLREAVEPHPPVDGDGGRPARRAPRLHARRGGRLRHPRAVEDIARIMAATTR